MRRLDRETTQFVWKIFDEVDGQLKTLFHANNKSRLVPVGEWLEAEQRYVSDGGKYYNSGWHVMPSLQECKEYLSRFKRVEDKVIAKCVARTIWPKHHSPANVYLAKYMKVHQVVWRYREEVKNVVLA